MWVCGGGEGTLFLQCQPAVDRPWKGKQPLARGRRGGGREQQRPQPRPTWSWLSAGQAGDLLGPHMAAGSTPLFSRVRQG